MVLNHLLNKKQKIRKNLHSWLEKRKQGTVGGFGDFPLFWCPICGALSPSAIVSNLPERKLWRRLRESVISLDRPVLGSG